MTPTKEWYVIGRGLAGWHAAGKNVTSSGGDLVDRPWWAGGVQRGYLNFAVDGCLVYDAADADETAFTRFVVSGPMVDPTLDPGEVNRFTERNIARHMAGALEGAFQTVAILAQSPTYGGLDSVGVEVYAGLLRDIPGIKIGRVRAGVIVWDAPCTHNAMIERPDDPAHAWQCAECGYVYGKE